MTRGEEKEQKKGIVHVLLSMYMFKFHLTCTCVAKEEEDDEVEEKEDEKEDQPDPHNKEHVATGPSRIAVSLSVGKGLLSLHLPVKVLPQLTYMR